LRKKRNVKSSRLPHLRKKGRKQGGISLSRKEGSTAFGHKEKGKKEEKRERGRRRERFPAGNRRKGGKKKFGERANWSTCRLPDRGAFRLNGEKEGRRSGKGTDARNIDDEELELPRTTKRHRGREGASPRGEKRKRRGERRQGEIIEFLLVARGRKKKTTATGGEKCVNSELIRRERARRLFLTEKGLRAPMEGAKRRLAGERLTAEGHPKKKKKRRRRPAMVDRGGKKEGVDTVELQEEEEGGGEKE